MPTAEAQVLRLVRKRGYSPLTAEDMADHLDVPPHEREEFFQMIEALKLAGEIVEVKHRCLADPDRLDLVVGTLTCNPRGFGFIAPVRRPGGEDLYVHGSNLSSAMHGDLVVARAPRAAGRGRRGRGFREPESAEVKIVSVLRRARTEIVGTFMQVQHVSYVAPDDPRLFRDVMVAAQDAREAHHGDKVSVRILTWPSRHINPTGTILEVFGPRRRIEAERLAVVHEFGLRHEFPPAAVRQAERVAPPAMPSEWADRADLTQEMIFTIDPEDAKDFDDAVSVRRFDDGWELGVHIADVSHYVEAESAIDLEARERATSVYLPGQVIPMLPEALSNEACSLKPDAPRLTKTVRMRFDAEGRRTRTEVFPSCIRSVRRFTYEEAQRALDGDALAPGEEALAEKLREMNALASLLKKRREAEGMLELDIPEARILTDAKGRTTGIVLRRGDAAHKLIEYFMLAANEAVAHYLVEHRLPYLCRAHDEPDPEDIREFRETAAVLGHALPPPGNKVQIQRFLKRIAGRPGESLLHYLLLRSMRMAEYSAEKRPHWAIGATHYLHFTSPIRRYPDLLVHRILDEHRDGRLKDPARRAYWDDHLPTWAAHATAQERRAEGAERAITLRRMKEYLAEQTGAMDAMIIAVDNYGMRVQLCDSLVEGVVRLSTLTDGFYRPDRARRVLVGPRQKTFRVGDVIRVRVAHFDELKYQIEFAPAGGRR